MSKKLSTKQRLELIDQWNAGKEEEIKKQGYYVMTNKSGVVNVRKQRVKEETKTPMKKEVRKEVRKEEVRKEEVKGKEEKQPRKPKTDKPNVL
jgi:hypothetical protein